MTLAIWPLSVKQEGYIFGGWYANVNFTGEAVTKIGANETGDRTFWAKRTLVPSLANGKVTAPRGAVLIVASYDKNGHMTAVRSFTAPAGGWDGVTAANIAAAAGVTLPGSYKLMLVDGTTYAPLCPAWER